MEAGDVRALRRYGRQVLARQLEHHVLKGKAAGVVYFEFKLGSTVALVDGPEVLEAEAVFLDHAQRVSRAAGRAGNLRRSREREQSKQQGQ